MVETMVETMVGAIVGTVVGVLVGTMVGGFGVVYGGSRIMNKASRVGYWWHKLVI